MDANGNQRKRAGRLTNKSGSSNNDSMGPPLQVSDDNEVLEVSPLAIPPIPNERESTNNAPAAECRRSSRKKIIKFDVRDLLNKNRKPHKIQIEARIDSNAPSTSKNITSSGGDVSYATTSSMSGDLLSKQKTFLEKSAIFRRYSISQEPKPPPPPLPLPPSLLGKGNDNKDPGLTTCRRLSRTQEFFSNVMIKPKQTTSLIVAQMESSAPSTVAGKRKSLNRTSEIEQKMPESTTSFANTALQKRRGRSKIKILNTEDAAAVAEAASNKEVENIKKLTPEKATNWKEYKACLAQQTTAKTDSSIATENIEKSSGKTIQSIVEDAILEISSSSSSQISITEDSKDLTTESKDFIKESKESKDSPKETKDSTAESLDKSLLKSLEEQQVKKKEDSPIQFNILAQIDIEDSNSTDNIFNPTEESDIVTDANTAKTFEEKLDTKVFENVEENTNDKNSKTEAPQLIETEQVSKDNENDKAKESLKINTKDSPNTEDDKTIEQDPIEPQEQLKKEETPLSNAETSSQSNKKETIRSRRQIKAQCSVENAANTKTRKSPTNLNDSSQEKTDSSSLSFKEFKIAKENENKQDDDVSITLHDVKGIIESQPSKEHATKKGRPTKQQEISKINLNESSNDSNISQTSKEINTRKSRQTKQDKVSKSSTSPKEEDIVTKNQIENDETKQKEKDFKGHKNPTNLDVSLQKVEEEIPNFSQLKPVIQEEVQVDIDTKTPTLLDDVQEDSKDYQPIRKDTVSSRRSRSRLENLAKDETDTKSGPIPKQSKVAKRNQTKIDETDLKSSKEDVTCEIKLDYPPHVDTKSDQVSKDQKIDKDGQTELDSVDKEINNEIFQATNEEMTSLSKLQDSLKHKICDITIEYTKKQTETYDKEKLTEKQIEPQKETKIKTSTEMEAENKPSNKSEHTKPQDEILNEQQREDFKNNAEIESKSVSTKLNKRKTQESAKEKELEAEIESKSVSTKLNKRKTQENAKEKELESSEFKADDNNLLKKQTPKSKRNLKKFEETIQTEENSKNSPSDSKKENAKQINTEQTTDKATENTSFREDEVFKHDQRMELKTPEPATYVTQIVHENTPKPSQTNPSSQTTQESSLCQPSTPSEEKSITFSRTSSSSESENISERSSYSSATSSTTTSSSTSSSRSYKSGDKLRVSIKRISLSNSPSSSSSQTSTSEEQSSPCLQRTDEKNKKKPPTAKRSKRLQKKYVEMMENQSIDDCFQKLPTDEKGVQQTLIISEHFEKLSDDKLLTKSIDCVKEVINETQKSISENKDDKPINKEVIKDDTTSSIQMETKQITDISSSKELTKSIKEQSVEDIKDLIKPTTSKGKNSKDNYTMVKRKSLRNRKENDSEETDQETKEILPKADEEIKETDQQKQENVLDEGTKIENNQKVGDQETEKQKELNLTKIENEKLKDEDDILTLTRQLKEQQKLQKKDENEKIDSEKRELEAQQEIENIEKIKLEEQKQKRKLKKQPLENEKLEIEKRELEARQEIENIEKIKQEEQQLEQKQNQRRKLKKQPSAHESETEGQESEKAKIAVEEIKSIGSTDTDSVEERIISTSNKPIKETKSKKTSYPAKSKVVVEDTINKPNEVKDKDDDKEGTSPTKSKAVKGKISKTKEIDEESLNKTTETNEKETTKQNVLSNDDNKYIEPSPSRSKTAKGKTSKSKKIIDEEPVLKTTEEKDACEETNKQDEPSKDDKEYLQPSPARSKTGKGRTSKTKVVGEELHNITEVIETSKLTAKLDVSNNDDKECYKPSPTRTKSDKEKNSKTKKVNEESLKETSEKQEDVEYSEPTQSEYGTDKTSACKKSTKLDIKENEPTTRSKRGKGKTSLEEAAGSPKSSVKFTEVTSKIAEIKTTEKETEKNKEEISEVKDITKYIDDANKKESPKIGPNKSKLQTAKLTKSEEEKSTDEFKEILQLPCEETTVKESSCSKEAKNSSEDITKSSAKIASKKSKLQTAKVTKSEEDQILPCEKTTVNEFSTSASSEEAKTLTEELTKSTPDLSALKSPKPCSSTKTKLDQEKPSAKRKSLRNQKDKINEETTSSSIEINEQDKSNKQQTKFTIEEPIFTSNIQEVIEKDKTKEPQEVIEKDKTKEHQTNDIIEESIVTYPQENKDKPTTAGVDEPIKVPKKRGRRSRFKNLHGPETESETESSTGQQTPIDEIMFLEKKDLTTTTIDKVNEKQVEKEIIVAKDKSIVKETELHQNKINKEIKEISKNTVPSTTIPPIKAKQITDKETKNSQIKGDVTAAVNVADNKQKQLITPTAAVPSETYLIKNVSIETNTLLDILRTVQSNTAAALEATKTTLNNQETKIPIDESLADTENKTVLDAEVVETKSDDLPSSSQNKSLVTLKSLKKIESNSNSPTRSDTASPLTLKKVAISPTRSDSSSPLTLKKVGQSPTRSETSSPLTLKKVTRRYERRSRRGEDNDHKTLEETFAEIAAQSSKAVLAAKSFDINEEIIESDKTEKVENIKLETDGGKSLKIVTEVLQSEVSDKVTETTSLEIPEKVIEAEQMALEVPKKVEDIKKSTSEIQEKAVDIEKTSTESTVIEKVLETPEISKVTPAKRGRKPKNRPLDVITTPTTKDAETKNSPKTDIEIMGKSKDSTLKETEISSTEEPTKTSKELCQQDDSNKEIEKKVTKITKEPQVTDTQQQEKSSDHDKKTPADISKQQDNFKESATAELIITEETSKKTQEDDFKTLKKSYKKRDTSKELPATPDNDNVILETPTKNKEDDIRTPKQTTKKRDSSLTKSETKSNSKKATKKTKNSEEESLVTIQKEDIIPKTTTPPAKRGRKPKNQQEPQSTTSSKKKNKKETLNESVEEDYQGEKRKELESESESLNSSLDKSIDEKMAKKKRQKKLKEAFEAALTDDLIKNKDIANTNSSNTSSFGLTLLNKSPPPERRESFVSESIISSCITPVEPEEDPDPLKDIEKFIADGVNLLKKDYKLDEDSVDDVIATTPNKTNEIEELLTTTTTEEEKPVFHLFETPADTPINTPSVTPPPKSPNSTECTTPDENSGVRRSHRIKKTPKALVGRGLVRDKERFSIKDDVETKSHYTLDDHLTDLAEVEAKNAKFLKEMEERLSNFQVIKENDYLCERVISREARKMICDCFLTHEEEERGELGCGEDCLNRLLMIECGPECNVKERCTNNCFQKLLCSPCRVFRTEKKGFGIMADIEILPGEFIMEYVGEVIDTDEFEQRRILYSQDKNRHYYFMALRSDAIIDATVKGNISRFINHSCDPNAETQKWTVNGELRIGFFSRKSIMPGEEITFNYQYQRYGREAQRCYCESSNCRGWIGPEPTSDEGEQIDDDEEDESEDDEEEEQDTSNLLAVQDDDEDSDASVTDPEEVQKKLEMAAAQAEVELAPISILEETVKPEESIVMDNKESDDSVKPEIEEEEDSKSKFKKLLSKMAEKVAAKQKQNKREQKLQRKKKTKETAADLANKLRFLEDPDIEDEVEFLRECGLKNQSDTLRLSRLMVRAKLVQTRLNLLDILRKGDLPCRRLFLDYHGLRLVHGWMSEDAGNIQIRLALLQTLDTLPIANKTLLTDSKVMQVVRSWCGPNTALSPNDDSSSSNSNSHDTSIQTNTNLEESSDLQELQKLALKLIATWEGLPEIFRIPKKERIEQMKEHEREADRQYEANAEKEENKTLTDRFRRDRFGKGFNSNTASNSNRFTKPNNGNPLRTTNTTNESNKNLSKTQRREMFEAKVARDEAEKRLAEERREFETKCRFFGLDPKKTRPQDVPFCVNPSSGQWYSIERKPIATPPSYAHVQVPVKPKSTDPIDYQLPGVCSTLPPQWKFAITPQGKIYYYHIKYRIPQWEPPTPAQLQQCEMEAEEGDSESELTTTAGEDSSEDDDEILIGMDAVQLRAYIDRKVETRRQKRYQRLVDQRAISPRREEDRIYNQIEVRKYKENKEKIRKRKEEIRRKRAEALRQSSLNMCTLGSITDTTLNTGIKLQTESDEELGVLPIQDYLLSSDEEIDFKGEVISPLIEKIVEGDKIVDELDALTSKRQLKRPLPPHRDFNEPSTSSAALITAIEKQEYKKRKLEKKEKRKPKDQDAKYRKNKEKFRCEIAGIIVHHLKPYRRDSCKIGRIQSNDDFNHLARKLTHFVVIKELKYCDSVGQTLVVTESVKNKSREFIKKYMAKYGDLYIKPLNDPDFKDIPFTL